MKRLKILSWILFAILTVIIVLNRQVLFDLIRGIFYMPTPEMLVVRGNLGLTSKGELLFNASYPELDTKEVFNEKCRKNDDTSAILGCYTEQKIYVYGIKDEELDGIVELTTAHELLHAVYERMNIGDRDNLKASLEKVLSDNREILEKEIEIYDETERLEELYVRAGTEIKKLPQELEEHYKQYFNDQDRIVDFYNKYIKVFREIENEFEILENEMVDLNNQIDTKTENYKNGIAVLNSEIERFNNCADTPGCFSNDNDFYVRRNELLYRQNELQNLYDEIDGLINKYNIDVEKFNNNIMRSENLQNKINSYERVNEL